MWILLSLHLLYCSRQIQEQIVNLINRKTFDQLFDSKVLKPTPIRMENYGNSTVKVFGNGSMHFVRWKSRVYKQFMST